MAKMPLTSIKTCDMILLVSESVSLKARSFLKGGLFLLEFLYAEVNHEAGKVCP